MRLSREAIVEAGLMLLREHGLDRVSLRAVAEHLQVKAPSIYWHVADKADLLALMLGVMYDKALDCVPDDVGWREWLLAYGHALRKTLMEYPDSARLCTTACVPYGKSQQTIDRMAAPLERHGLSHRQALLFQSSVISYTVGWAGFEQSHSFTPLLSNMVGFKESFPIGLDAMIKGFEVQKRAAATKKPTVSRARAAG